MMEEPTSFAKQDVPYIQTPHEIDPSSGKTARCLMVFETVLNLSQSAFMILAPLDFLPLFFPLNAESMASEKIPITQSAELPMCIRFGGAFLMAATVPMILAIPNRHGAIERRQIAQASLAAFEAVWVPLILGEFLKKDNVLNIQKVFFTQVVSMSVAICFRLYAIFVKPYWLGSYRVKKTSKRSQ
ncbi:hypothetical protein BS50DRAFT_576783 [Corynespora cassiicola Philippines]|uniref:Uncharacterized protein n=1 Tax=Corynespora cassiicola Philippines TaxID=1448308 RepID=A0A2T2NC13_CORCC|nr:hypothetical protein BS50DRAFT_576783 [Corynespora cassiicola Philippines]